MSKQYICYSVRDVKKIKCQHDLVLSGEGICAEDVGVGDCVAEGREEGVEAFDVLREGADDEEVGLGRGEREQEVGRGWAQ